VSATTSLFYSLDYQASVSITVFDALGRIVSYPIQNQIQRAGSHEVAFDTKDFPNGLYWCRLAGEGIEQAAKLIINR
jgi:hypothetical protein